ncbi:ssDNA-binding protein [Moraxella lincolnii]|uniref:DUF2815 domain-containing protein n=1 Tax=Lwoffella lincolnii TaxID=90241 RepID=A0A1T0CKC3_9GAMM|nr:ssDNA-binding protein [Moraxella lincolnii]OOS22743.1 hypothetical protein B0682_00525 [Moraxella lincolnii]
MKLTLKNVRLAFPNIFRPSEQFDNFGAQLIIEKGSANAKAIDNAINEVAKAKWGIKADSIVKQLKSGNKICFIDGDAKAEYEGFEGNMALSATNRQRPTVFNKDRSPLTEADGVVYAGCYVNAIVEIWAQDNQWGKRINASLKGVQFYANGDAFAGGGVASEDDFDDISEGAEAEEFV